MEHKAFCEFSFLVLLFINIINTSWFSFSCAFKDRNLFIVLVSSPLWSGNGAIKNYYTFLNEAICFSAPSVGYVRGGRARKEIKVKKKENDFSWRKHGPVKTIFLFFYCYPIFIANLPFLYFIPRDTELYFIVLYLLVKVLLLFFFYFMSFCHLMDLIANWIALCVMCAGVWNNKITSLWAFKSKSNLCCFLKLIWINKNKYEENDEERKDKRIRKKKLCHNTTILKSRTFFGNILLFAFCIIHLGIVWKYLPGNLYSHLVLSLSSGKYFMYLNPYQILKLYYFPFPFSFLLFLSSCENYGKSNSEWKYRKKDNKFHGKLHTEKKLVGIEGENEGEKISISLVFYWIKSKKRKIKHQQIEAVQKFTRVDFSQQKKRDGSGTTTTNKNCHE